MGEREASEHVAGVWHDVHRDAGVVAFTEDVDRYAAAVRSHVELEPVGGPPPAPLAELDLQAAANARLGGGPDAPARHDRLHRQLREAQLRRARGGRR